MARFPLAVAGKVLGVRIPTAEHGVLVVAAQDGAVGMLEQVGRSPPESGTNPVRTCPAGQKTPMSSAQASLARFVVASEVIPTAYSPALQGVVPSPDAIEPVISVTLKQLLPSPSQ